MKRVAVLAMIVSALASCSGTETTEVAETTDPTAAVASDAEEAGDAEGDRPVLMATALEQLVAEDNTFGEGPPPFTEYLIQSHVAADDGEGDGRPLTAAEREAVEHAIRPFGPVRWIEDADDWRTDDIRPTIEGAVILGVGEPTIDGGSALVPVSLWCGGLCATWLTYRLDVVDGTWQVVGTDGPIAIA